MNQLNLNENNSDLAIKQINSFRLKNKGKWYQVELFSNGCVYKLKCYETWVQLGYKYKDGILLYNSSSYMDMNIAEFKEFLKQLINP